MSWADEASKITNQCIAQGINAAMDELLADARGNAPLRTGTLVSGFSITVADPDKLNASLVNTVGYSGKYYPFTENMGIRPRFQGGRPHFGVMAQPPNAIELLLEAKIAIAMQQKGFK